MFEIGDRVTVVGSVEEFQVVSVFGTPAEIFYDLRINQDLTSMRRARECDMALVAKAERLPQGPPRLLPATNILDY
jgi:hypothetical protein